MRDFIFKRVGFMAVLAINGSGKTTLFRAMSKLLPLVVDISQLLLLCFIMRSVEWLDGKLKWDGLPSSYQKHLKSDLNLGRNRLLGNVWLYQPSHRKYSLGMKQRLVIAMYFSVRRNAGSWMSNKWFRQYYRQKFLIDWHKSIDRTAGSFEFPLQRGV